MKDCNWEKIQKLSLNNPIIKFYLYEHKHFKNCEEEDLLINIIENLTKVNDSLLDKLIDLNMRSLCSTILLEKN